MASVVYVHPTSKNFVRAMIFSPSQRRIEGVTQGCHQEPGAKDFPRLLREWPLATFIGKLKKNRAKRNP